MKENQQQRGEKTLSPDLRHGTSRVVKTALCYIINLTLIAAVLGVFVGTNLFIASVDGWLVAALVAFAEVALIAAFFVNDYEKWRKEKESEKGGGL